MTIDLPDDGERAERLELSAPGVRAVVDLVAGGRVASLIVGGRDAQDERRRPRQVGSFPMVPFAGRVRDAVLHVDGVELPLPPRLPPHAIHGTALDRWWDVVGEATIATELGPDWPFRGRTVQRFELGPDHLTCRLELHADEPMPASIGWHPYFLRRLDGVDAPVELDFDAGLMIVRDAAGIATDETVVPGPGPWDDCFLDVRGRALAWLPRADGRIGLPRGR